MRCCLSSGGNLYAPAPASSRLVPARVCSVITSHRDDFCTSSIANNVVLPSPIERRTAYRGRVEVVPGINPRTAPVPIQVQTISIKIVARISLPLVHAGIQSKIITIWGSTYHHDPIVSPTNAEHTVHHVALLVRL